MEVFQSIFEYAPDAVVVVDMEGRIARVNAQAENMFGYQRDELIGEWVEILVPPRLVNRHVSHRNWFLKEPRLRPMGAGLDLYGKRKDDTELPVDIMLSALTTDEGQFVLGVVRDISERKRAEQRMVELLREKDVLLQEIHHRVKNNLAVISSLFYLQSTHTADEQTLRMLEESQDRVRSIALVHETLCHSGSFSDLDFSAYTRTLCEQLFRTYAVNAEDIRLTTRLQSVRVGIDMAVPCGLILSELISNALKHAFPNDHHGEIRISLEPNGGDRCRLSVADNGVGISDGIDLSRSRSLGLQMIRSLTTQLDGEFTLEAGQPGTVACLQFKTTHE